MASRGMHILSGILLLLYSTKLALSLPLFPIVQINQTQVYIVHVQHPNGPSKLLAREDRERWYNSFLPKTTLDSGEPRMIHSYVVVMSGFAARLTPDEVKAMESIPGFLFAYPDEPVYPRTTRTPSILGLDGYNSLWQNTNQGEGMIIGVIDTGITPDHISFSDPGLPEPPLKWRGICTPPVNCSNKLIGAQVFAHKAKRSPIDEKGHGTHVAAIAAGTPVPGTSVLGQASGKASGMAPRAHIASYKTCSSTSCTNGNTIKGFDQAIMDGVDLIQISLGASNSSYNKNGIVIGSFAALKNGILTVNSAGNDGPVKSILDNDVPWILHVGAANIDRRVTGVLKLGNGMEFVGVSVYQPNPSPAIDLPLVYPGVNQTQKTLACQKGSMDGFDVKGKMVLCGTGHIDNTNKGDIVKDAGGAAMIVMNQPSQGETLSADPHKIPTVHVSYNDAIKILDYYQTASNATGTLIFKGTKYGIRPSPTVASFSSRGPSLLNGGILKPDIIAPGVAILSAWPFKVGSTLRDSNNTSKNFIMESGTSMAAPHVSGVAALLKKSHPDWSPAAIKSAIMTTAKIKDRNGDPIIDDASDKHDRANIFATGAGHINPTAANNPGLVYDFTNTDDYIPYLCSLKGYSSPMVTTIVNEFVTCPARKMAAEDVNYPSIQISMGAAGAQNKTVRRTVKNVGEASSEYTSSILEPSGVKVVVSPKTLKFSRIGEERNFTVELSLGKTKINRDDVLEGRLIWVSKGKDKREVSSPIVVTA